MRIDSLKYRKFPVSKMKMPSQSKEVIRVWVDRKANITQINFYYKQGMQKSVPEHTTEAGSRLATAAKTAAGPHSCQLRGGNWSYSLHRLYNISKAEESLFLLWHLDDRPRHFRSLRTNYELFKHHSLPDYCCCVPIFWWLLPGGKHF